MVIVGGIGAQSIEAPPGSSLAFDAAGAQNSGAIAIVLSDY